MENTKALTVQDVAEILKIAKNTVYELIKRGEINSYKVGRKVRFTLSDVEDYIQNSKVIQPVQKNNKINLNQNISEEKDDDEFIICGQDLMLDILSNYYVSCSVTYSFVILTVERNLSKRNFISICSN